MNIKVKLLRPSAIVPTKSHRGDLGFDLYASEPVSVRADQIITVSTGIALQFPFGWGAFLKDRSSVAKRQLFTVGGVIDNGYQGEIQGSVKHEEAKANS